MFLAINVFNLIYTCVFLIMFTLSYFVLIATNLDKLFKQGFIWQIRLAYVLFAIILAYLETEGIMALIKSTQFN